MNRLILEQPPSSPHDAPVASADDVYVFPASFAQQRLWFLEQFQGSSPSYNIPTAVQIEGPLGAAAFARSIDEIVRRHESLRTTFAMMEGEVVQVIHPQSNVELRRVDLAQLDGEICQRETSRLLAREATRPFQLTHGPLLRPVLIRRAPDEHVFVVTMHHAITDGWSMAVFVRELSILYDTFSRGQPSPLPALKVQYADYAQWQQEWLGNHVLEQQLAYWREQLGAEQTVLQLPTDRPRPAVLRPRGAKQRDQLPRKIWDAVESLSRKEEATPFITLLAAFQVLLHRLSGQSDISVGTAIANRNRAEIEPLIGFFVNTLVMRTDLSGNPTFRQLLRRVREVALAAYDHQDVPFEKLVVELNPRRDMSHTPLFQVLFVLQNTPPDHVAAKSGALRLRSLSVDKKTSNFDLTLSMTAGIEAIHTTLEYNTELFSADTARGMLEKYGVLLESILDQPDAPIGSLNMLSDFARQQIVRQWNRTQTDYAWQGCLHELIEQQVGRCPDAVAVACDGQQITYRHLEHRANQLARLLQRHGVGPDVLVGVCVERSLEMVVGLLAILKAGGAYVPLDPSYPAERLAFMLENAQAPVLLTQQRLLAALPKFAGPIVCVDAPRGEIALESRQEPWPGVSCDNLAYVIYTSGSTGTPKGAMNSHRAICNRLLWMQQAYRLSSGDTVLQKTPFSFDVSVWEFFWPLMVGARLVMAKPGGHQDTQYLVGCLLREQVTTLHFVPSMLQSFLMEPRVPSCDSVQRVICSGEALPIDLQDRFFARINADLTNLYGPTEAAIDVTAWECQRHSSRGTVPIGKPIANTQIHVLDSESQPVAVRVAGELHIGGVGLARGYYRRPDLTAERFIPNPLACAPGTRLYRSGDLARYAADGNVEYIGRLDHQVKIRGFRIELGEIEAALVTHPAIDEAIVVMREDSPENKRLIAYFVTSQTPLPSIDELREHLLATLPEYMVPAAMVRLDQLPLSPNGKVDRRRLPAPQRLRDYATRSFVAPRSAVEEMLAGIWSRNLGGMRVGVEDNFFELGGHSLLALQIVAQVRDVFPVDLSVRNVFQYPTIASFAGQVEFALRTSSPLPRARLEPIPRDEPLRLSFAQERLWFLSQLNPTSPLYNVSAGYGISGPLSLPILRRCLDEIVRRHEVLRTAFVVGDSDPRQVIAPPAPLPVPLIDLEGLAGEERRVETRRLARREATRPFDLAHGPLLRIVVLRLCEDEHVILLTVHHIVCDDWSTFIYLREIAELYDAFARGGPSPLPELAIQYADYAHWQRELLKGELLEAQLDYWTRQLAGVRPLQLPTDRPRPRVQSWRGASRSFTLSKELSTAVRELSTQEGVTVFMTLLAGFKLLLHRYCSQDDICIGSPITNRSHTELQRLIGFFVNTLALRTDLSGDPTCRALLRRVRDVALEAYAHQELPFERLVDSLRPDRDLSRSPIFEVMFAMHSALGQIPTMARSGLDVQALRADAPVSKFDLTLFMTDRGDRLSGTMNFNRDLFDEATIDGLLECFQRLLDGFTSDPDQRICQVPLLTEVQCKSQLALACGPIDQASRDECFHHVFEQQASRTPDAIAVVFENETLTYGELDRRAHQLARHLHEIGIEPDALVGVFMDRSLDMLVGLLGVLKAGGAYVPLDPSMPQKRLEFMLADSGAAIVLSREKFLARLPRHEARIVCLDTNWRENDRASGDRRITGVRPDNLAYVMYTSGSTGQPKGTLVTHRGLTNYLRWTQTAYPLEAGHGSIVHSTICFDATITALLCPLLVGRSVRLLPEGLAVDTLGDALRHDGGHSLIKITPAHLDLLSQQLSRDEAAGLAKAFVIGGENLRGQQIRFWQQYAGDTHLFNEYGPTETVVGCVVYRVEPRDRFPGSVPIGRPIPNTQAHVLDRQLQPVAPGACGELYLGGAGLARGYLHRADLTAERFVPHPLGAESTRLYKTGDLARLRSDGQLEFLGRVDGQVKIRGHRIECGEIASVLNQHPRVQDAAVLAQPTARGDQRLVAYYVGSSTNGKLRHNELRDFVGKWLPEIMVPSAFMELPALPLTANGKVDRRSLPVPDASRPELEAPFVPPQTPTQEILAAIWAEVLDVDKVGIDDHFFHLGGHSLLATQITSRIVRAFEVQLPLRRMFETPTVAGLAELIDTMSWAARNSSQPQVADGDGRVVGEL